MKHFKHILLSLILCSKTFSPSFSQSKVGGWADHFYYGKCIGADFWGDYAVGATDKSLVLFNKNLNEVKRYNKIHGLSDIDITTIASVQNKLLLIGYLNGNIDILYEDFTVQNLSDIKNKSINFSKKINRFKHLSVANEEFFFVLTEFGVLRIDPFSLSVLETYNLNSNYLNCYDVCLFNDSIYVATDKGLFYAPKNKNLQDFNSWKSFPQFINKKIMFVFEFSGKLYAIQQTTLPAQNDSLFVKTNTFFTPSNDFTSLKFLDVKKNPSGDITFTYTDRIVLYDANKNVLDLIYQLNNKFLEPSSAYYDSQRGYSVIADKNLGLILYRNQNELDFIEPNGPYRGNFFKMDLKSNTLVGVPGIWDFFSFNPTYYTEGVHIFQNNEWKSIRREVSPFDTAFDLVNVIIDPADNNHFFICSYGTGLYEIKNYQLVDHYAPANSSLKSNPLFYFVGVSAAAFDSKGNLWVTNSTVPEALHVLTKNKQWFSFNLSPFQSNQVVSGLYIDQYDQKWIIQGRDNAVILFDENGTFDNTSDDRKILLSASNGSIPDGDFLYCIKEDKNGILWLGTNKGIFSINNPSQILDLGYGKANEILIIQDGNVQKLFETEAILDIEVDGANRKWIATEKSGVFLMSEDFNEQIDHFTFANSPLPSDFVSDIAINQETGDVYFATEKGLVSYRGFATEGEEHCNNYLIYPNPVKKGFEGYLTIRNLVADSKVTILTIDGYKIYENTTLGGQFFWDMKNFRGEKIKPGVYVAVCTPPNGLNSCSMKFVILSD